MWALMCMKYWAFGKNTGEPELADNATYGTCFAALARHSRPKLQKDVFGRDLPDRFSKDTRSLDNVAQLTHVPLPVVLLKNLKCLAGD